MPIPDVMPISTWKDLRTVLVKTKSPSDIEIAREILPNKNIKYAQSFFHLRGAVEFLFNNLHLNKKKVIFPRYICGSVLRAAERAGVKVEFCPVDKKGRLLTDFFEKMPLSEFGAVFLVHPFGLEIDTEKISLLCKKHKLFLIEDMAHSFSIKPHGDILLYHFAKKFPNMHGGIMISHNIDFPLLHEKYCCNLKDVFFLLLKTKLLRICLNLWRSTKTIAVDGDALNDKDYSKLLGASDASKRLFLKSLKGCSKDGEKIGIIYRAYFDKLPENYVKILKEPVRDYFHFPVLVPEDKNRDEILLCLRKFNIFADRLWYNADCDFAKKILLLPVNKYMNTKDVIRICNLLKSPLHNV